MVKTMSTPEIHAHLPAEKSEPMSTTAPTSPFDIPEIASLIASYISENSDLARCARVSYSLHDVCIPILWKSTYVRKLTFLYHSRADKELRLGRFRYDYLSLIKELTFGGEVNDDDLKTVAENCTGLEVLNFDEAHVTAKSLAILLPKNLSQTRVSDPDDGSKRHRTRFPACLKSLSFERCWKLPGPACLKMVSLLGPQLERLSLSGFKDIRDEDTIKFVRRCPNLIGLRLNDTRITDEFLKSFAQEYLHSDSTSTPGRRRQQLENLNLDSSKVSSEGIIPVVLACRSTLKSLSAQCVKSMNDDVLFALVYNFINGNATEGSKFAPYVTSEADGPQDAREKTPIMHHRFSPNTVLTEIRLWASSDLTDAGFQVLFRFATELASIKLSSRAVRDGALMVLAETYRTRMKALGLGVPVAWREYELAEERVQAMGQVEAAAEGHQATSTAVTSASKGSKSNSDSTARVFTNGRVPGGLKRLYLHGGSKITNKGVRALLRSCVGLEFLDISAGIALTLELFHGPWACSRLKDLSMSGVALEITSEDFEASEDDLDDNDDLDGFTNGHYDYGAARKAQYREEVAESSRFPLAINPYPQEDDFDEGGDYEHMTIPARAYCNGGNEVRGNTPRQRAILRGFYSKLGQLSQLRTLDIHHSNFRVRVKDGLELVLPGLQQNLTRWKLDLVYGHQMGNSELEFFGKHFGYGHDFAAKKDHYQVQLEVKTRKAPLHDLILSGVEHRHVHREVMGWTGRQGFVFDLNNFENLGSWY